LKFSLRMLRSSRKIRFTVLWWIPSIYAIFLWDRYPSPLISAGTVSTFPVSQNLPDMGKSANSGHPHRRMRSTSWRPAARSLSAFSQCFAHPHSLCFLIESFGFWRRRWNTCLDIRVGFRMWVNLSFFTSRRCVPKLTDFTPCSGFCLSLLTRRQGRFCRLFWRHYLWSTV
jgi:hypothetical protein